MQAGHAQAEAQAGDDAGGRQHAGAQAVPLPEGLHAHAAAAAAQQQHIGRRLARSDTLGIQRVNLRMWAAEGVNGQHGAEAGLQTSALGISLDKVVISCYCEIQLRCNVAVSSC